ncbi:dihydrolipoamide acetyltransferase family protein [Desulfofustis limnaeus]|jgi:pyruvate dehydrogenase E2 component (dihydrolipoamide acetyltransferase)|nr:dihydrolipoamide acetyltransferase family protein [Desulfofustis limnaeus]MDX9894231.1 dihydrolipoamide acetyltransferase family protein [Desulfofustis sp.]
MSGSFRLPDLGEGVHEAEILAIHVRVGQTIKEGEPLLEVETDKAAVEIPSPVTGTVQQIMAGAGDLVKVGDVLITFGEVAESAPDGTEATKGEQSPVGRSADSSSRPVPASPATRRLARELGVDLQQVTATGPGGVVSGDDVRTFAAGRSSGGTQPLSAQKTMSTVATGTVSADVELPDFSHWGPVERQPFRSIRRATAARMADSWARIPHVNCQDTADITRLEEFRNRHKGEIEAAGGRLTMTVFAMKAVATALKQFPHFNASLDLTAQEIVVKRYFHIGIAADTEHGLVVPVIRDVDRKSIKELAVELQGALERARSRQSSRDELVGGTFTITNVGGLGGGFFSAIINYPEVAILGLGQARRQPVVSIGSRGEEQVAIRLILPVVLCFDHRVVDGADAIRFLRQIISLLQDPDELFISMI